MKKREALPNGQQKPMIIWQEKILGEMDAEGQTPEAMMIRIVRTQYNTLALETATTKDSLGEWRWDVFDADFVEEVLESSKVLDDVLNALVSSIASMYARRS